MPNARIAAGVSMQINRSGPRRALPKFESYETLETATVWRRRGKSAIEWFYGIARLARSIVTRDSASVPGFPSTDSDHKWISTSIGSAIGRRHDQLRCLVGTVRTYGRPARPIVWRSQCLLFRCAFSSHRSPNAESRSRRNGVVMLPRRP
jgi:hypothetical protein